MIRAEGEVEKWAINVSKIEVANIELRQCGDISELRWLKATGIHERARLVCTLTFRPSLLRSPSSKWERNRGWREQSVIKQITRRLMRFTLRISLRHRDEWPSDLLIAQPQSYPMTELFGFHDRSAAMSNESATSGNDHKPRTFGFAFLFFLSLLRWPWVSSIEFTAKLLFRYDFEWRAAA